MQPAWKVSRHSNSVNRKGRKGSGRVEVMHLDTIFLANVRRQRELRAENPVRFEFGKTIDSRA
jgi:hypothetical protein